MNVLGYAALLWYLHSTVKLRLKENFLLPLVIGTAVAVLIAFVLAPAIEHILPAATDMENASIRLVGFGIFILGTCIGIEYVFRPNLYRARLAEVAMKLRRSK